MGIRNYPIYMVRQSQRPLFCLETRITWQTIYFMDKPISLTLISEATGIQHSQLSKLFSGRRKCSLKAARLVSKALGMDLEPFVQALEERIASLRQDHHLTTIAS